MDDARLGLLQREQSGRLPSRRAHGSHCGVLVDAWWQGLVLPPLGLAPGYLLPYQCYSGEDVTRQQP